VCTALEIRNSADERKDDFGKMLQEAKLDVLVVTTVDATHDQYIIPALKAGIRVLTEKPMTTWVTVT
jgi:predicted dehydrogenase